MKNNRRDFIKNMGILGISSAFKENIFAEINKKVPKLKLGYSAITWGGNDLKAIEEISATGYKGIQLRANCYKPYFGKEAELKAKVDAAKLNLCMFSSGSVEVDQNKIEANIAQHVAHAKFVKALGGSAIQLTNSLRKKGEAPTTEELNQLIAAMNEIGKRTADLGIQAAYHNHMHQWGETPAEVEYLMQKANPKYLKFLLDVAHYHQGGGKPAEVILQFKDILHALHIKDVMCPLPDKPFDATAYKFVELGEGIVDFPAIFASLKKINFKNWAIVELDSVPEISKSPIGCAQTSKAFLKNKIGFKL